MNIRGCAGNLGLAVKDLKIEWELTESYWRDIKSDEFSDKYLSQVPDLVARARAAMEELDTLIRKVRSDCE
jgi:hypothetical protein